MRRLTDIIDTILNGTDSEKQVLQMSYFEIADTPPFLAELGMKGEKFTIRYGVITHHKKKDSDHDFSADEWKQICAKITEPLDRNIIYVRKKITPEQQALLDRTNLRQYPANGR